MTTAHHLHPANDRSAATGQCRSPVVSAGAVVSSARGDSTGHGKRDGWNVGLEGRAEEEMRYNYKYFESRCLLPDLTDAGGRRKD